MRKNNRSNNEMRPILITPNFTEYAEGSVLVEFGQTRVLCTASIERNLPKWLQGNGQGWITAEYGMLPRSTHTRISREKANSSGRSQEISRLIGRSLRAAVDLKKLGERQIVIDCDVIQADGGTRTAAITGGFVALALSIKRQMNIAEIKTSPLLHYIAAVSVGIKNNELFLDLDYNEDSTIQTDMNFVMCEDGGIIEVQGTAEGTPFHETQLVNMLDLARSGCNLLFNEQKKIIGELL